MDTGEFLVTMFPLSQFSGKMTLPDRFMPKAAAAAKLLPLKSRVPTIFSPGLSNVFNKETLATSNPDEFRILAKKAVDARDEKM